ncbi:MAG TPA: aminotransferase class V-fold PLP-dependent enzyme [Steroidobacteraceae bacterium]|nr:aminotransferase class V-fold PLP-dependent enzyme [Steroidobacteraceae bacterium]
MADPIYLDYAATTPVDPAVAEAMGRCLTGPDATGNASSATHIFGRRAAERIEGARAEVAALIGALPGEIVFTSGATESNNLAVLGAARANAHRGRHVVSSRIEHKAVLDPVKRLEKEGFAVTLLSPDRSGRVDPEAVGAALRKDTVLVSIMLVNNEIGVIQDIAATGALCRARGVLFHSDAAQAAGKIPLDAHSLPLDYMSFTAHKLYGPKGVGALYVRRDARAHLQPIVFGGGQERGLRPGTLPTHQIVGFGVACDLARRGLPAEHARLAVLRERLWQGLARIGGVHVNGEGAPCVPGILNVSFEGVEGESLVTGLRELAVSTGSACNSASAEPSYVLRALGRDTQLAESALRLSFGRFSLPEHIDAAVDAISREVTRLRALSPASEPAENPLPTPGASQVIGEAGGPGQEVWVRFRLAVQDGIVKSALVKAYGCPHTLDSAAWVAERLRGRGRADLAPGTPAEWAEALAVPVEKLGRLLVVEDALEDCARHWPEPR